MERWNAQNIELLQDGGGGGAPENECFVVQMHCLLSFFMGHLTFAELVRQFPNDLHIGNTILYLHASPAGQTKQQSSLQCT